MAVMGQSLTSNAHPAANLGGIKVSDFSPALRLAIG